MCGIAAIISRDPSKVTLERLKRMTESISHRGPDGETHWMNPAGNVGFGHRRLAILDLSAAALQPMHYLGRYTILHNGEIYNYLELRAYLETKGYVFRSRSDTEVILAAFDHYGTDCCVHFDGMFAFAIWDEQEQKLFAARDRFGEKPFYYLQQAEQLLFASEMKAIFAAGAERRVDPAAIINFLAIGYTANGSTPDSTIFEGVLELPPAHTLIYNARTSSVNISRYWQLNKEAVTEISEADAITEFQALWSTAVSRRRRSDVPVGALLSGGLDSSAIVATLADSTPGRLSTFSAIFPGFPKNESAYIDMINQQFNCAEHLVQPDAENLVNDLDRLAWYQEGFISSASIYAQYCVYARAKQENITVLFDGQGADETLGGYSKHIPWALQELYRFDRNGFHTLKQAFRNSGQTVNWSWRNALASYLPKITAGRLWERTLNQVKNISILNRDFVSSYHSASHLPEKPVVRRLNDILYHDTFQYGLKSLLQYADRNSMAHGREVRLPFLSHELVNFIFSLPLHFKIRSGFTKWILRKTMDDTLPPAITWRTDKVGFEPPQRVWMQHPLLQQRIREARARLVDQKILSPKVLTKKIQPLDSHAADNFDWRILSTQGLLS